MLIMLCLTPLIIITFISVIFGKDFLSANYNFYGELSMFEINIDDMTGVIAIIFVIAIFTVLVGIRILATGISETSVKALSSGLVYTGIWTLLSLLSAELIFEIEIVGSLIYVSLTIGYVIGVVEKMYGG